MSERYSDRISSEGHRRSPRSSHSRTARPSGNRPPSSSRYDATRNREASASRRRVEPNRQQQVKRSFGEIGSSIASIQTLVTRRDVILLGGGALIGFAVGGLLHGRPADTAGTQPEDAGAQNDGQQDEQATTANEEEATAMSAKDLPWNLVLVNHDHPLPDDYEPSALKDLPMGIYTDTERAQQVDERAYDDLMDMLEAASEDNVGPFVCSSYRTFDYQQNLYDNRVAQAELEGYEGDEAEKEAAFWVAPPGTSEHHTGLAVDIVDASYTALDETQESTDAQRWLMEHCADYGFILRYPTDKSDVTGIGYEPWHYRYVGKEAARDITDSGLCFEEWLKQTYNIQD